MFLWFYLIFVREDLTFYFPTRSTPKATKSTLSMTFGYLLNLIQSLFEILSQNVSNINYTKAIPRQSSTEAFILSITIAKSKIFSIPTKYNINSSNRRIKDLNSSATHVTTKCLFNKFLIIITCTSHLTLVEAWFFVTNIILSILSTSSYQSYYCHITKKQFYFFIFINTNISIYVLSSVFASRSWYFLRFLEVSDSYETTWIVSLCVDDFDSIISKGKYWKVIVLLSLNTYLFKKTS